MTANMPAPVACEHIKDCTTPNLCLSVGTCKGYFVMPASVRASAKDRLLPVAWTLKSELQKRETTCKAHLWFVNPQNSSWEPLVTLESALSYAEKVRGEAPTCDVGHAHFTPFYLLSNCRRVVSAAYARKPNWVLAMELFAVGSTTAHRICRDAGIDPDATEVRALAGKKASHD